MSVRLPEDLAWEFLARAHTGIFTTLRRDGSPIALPVWFVVDQRRIYVGTPVGAKKVQRIGHDERGSFLVEAGEAWTDLTAVHVSVTGRVLDPDADHEEILGASALLDHKYAGFRPAASSMPTATSEHYRRQAIIRLESVGRLLSWDNRRIRLRSSATEDG